MELKRLSILGSTGSIGTNTLDVVRMFPERFKVTALAAGRNVRLLAQQIREFQPLLVSVPGEREQEGLKKELGHIKMPEILIGQDGLQKTSALPEADMVVIGISGSLGLLPTYWAIDSGHDVALANKESLVMAGKIITQLAEKREVRLLSVDSEHSAIFHCLLGKKREDVRRIFLTASGGPFKEYTLDQMRDLTPEMALAHPVWQMGKKVTIDSSTMMNKGLEVIEARWLFDIPPERISILVHPESIVHSMVAFNDQSVIAQLSIPDMRIPIMKALSFPDTLHSNLPELDLSKIGALTFSVPDEERFPCIRLAYRAIEAGESLPVALNAANEVAVDAFCQRKIGFPDIPKIIKTCMDEHETHPIRTIEDALSIDLKTRDRAKKFLKE